MSLSSPGRWGGPALMLGALMFMLTKTRGYVDPDDSLLGFFMFVGFGLWIVGLAALYLRYAPVSGGVGKVGIGTSIAGIVLLAVAHPFSFMTGTDLFGLIVLGALALTIGPFLFGLASWPKLLYGPTAPPMEILPGRWRYLPLLTGLAGVAWFFNPAISLAVDAFARFTGLAGGTWFHANDEVAFFVFRTLFAAGWLLMGYVLFSDAEVSMKRATTAREV